MPSPGSPATLVQVLRRGPAVWMDSSEVVLIHQMGDGVTERCEPSSRSEAGADPPPGLRGLRANPRGLHEPHARWGAKRSGRR
jgi:hypothetical protein